MFIFAVFGMSLFKNVQIRGGFNDVHNFKTFFKTFILLFQMATSAGWDGTLNAIFDDTDCKLPDTEIGETGDCGKFAAGVAYMIAYLTLRYNVINVRLHQNDLNFQFPDYCEYVHCCDSGELLPSN